MIINARFRGYCNKCFFTIFKNERCRLEGKVFHMDCEEALSDNYPRSLNPDYKRRIGKVTKEQMKTLLKQRKSLKV